MNNTMSLFDRLVARSRAVRRVLHVQSGQDFEAFAGNAAQVPDTEKTMTDIHRFFYSNVNGPLVHKWRNYLAVYDSHLTRFRKNDRSTPLRLLEIGVSRGGSLRLWRSYFGPNAVIFGIDIDERCRRFNGQDGQVRIGSQTDVHFLRATVKEMGGLDIVIDDGSHFASHQKATFECLFPLISSDGVYICEDLHTSYWHGIYEGGYRRRTTFIEFAKTIVDDLHSDFHRQPSGVANASREVGGIHFYNSILVIEKEPQAPPVHIRVGRENAPEGPRPEGPSMQLDVILLRTIAKCSTLGE